ncbi:MAG: hypothetical protein Q9184_001418 [Pyrenodesmia sp. 2 TL-2023]
MSQNRPSRNPRNQSIEIPDSEPRRLLAYRGISPTPTQPSSTPISSSAASNESPSFPSPELPLISNRRRPNNPPFPGASNESSPFPSPELPLNSDRCRQNNPPSDQSDDSDQDNWQDDPNTFPIAIKHASFDTFLLINARWGMQRLHREILQTFRRELPSSIFTHKQITDLKVHFERGQSALRDQYPGPGFRWDPARGGVVAQDGDGRRFPREMVMTPGRLRAVLEVLKRRGRNDFVEVAVG